MTVCRFELSLEADSLIFLFLLTNNELNKGVYNGQSS